MEAWVADDVIRQAIRDGRADATLGSAKQWDAVEAYVDGRGPDPWPARYGHIDSQGADLEQLTSWLASDVALAAPLMGAFTSHDTDIEHADVRVSEDEIRRLQDWLGDQYGQDVNVVSATVIGGGFSRRMWRVCLDVAGAEVRIIVRIEQGGMFGTDTPSEVAAMRALYSAGFSVPRIMFVEEGGDVLGEPYFVMEEVPGAVRLDDQGLDDIIRSVAELHRVPVTVLDSSGRSAHEVVSDNIEGWRTMYRKHSPVIPLVEQATEWLHRNLEPTGDSVIVHGDAGPGNALFDPVKGLTTIDWEFAHVGDAAEDWAYLALIRGRRIMDAQSWKARLTDVAGIEYSPEQWTQWLAYNHYRGACVNLSARTVFERGPRRTADQLAIGVAVHLRFLSQLTEITCA